MREQDSKHATQVECGCDEIESAQARKLPKQTSAEDAAALTAEAQDYGELAEEVCAGWIWSG